jgi:hypothetical protein
MVGIKSELHLGHFTFASAYKNLVYKFSSPAMVCRPFRDSVPNRKWAFWILLGRPHALKTLLHGERLPQSGELRCDFPNCRYRPEADAQRTVARPRAPEVAQRPPATFSCRGFCPEFLSVHPRRSDNSRLATATHHLLNDGAELLAEFVFEEFLRHNGCRQGTRNHFEVVDQFCTIAIGRHRH